MQVASAAGVNAGEVAIHAMALTLFLARNLATAGRLQAEQRWDAQAVVKGMTPLDDAFLLCVGYGAIGRTVTKIAKAFGMRTVSFNRTGKGAVDGDDVRILTELDDHLPFAKLVVVCVPAGAETRKLFDHRRFALLPEGYILVNVGRGEVVDEDALVDELRSGRAAGAALDVMQEEPLGAESPLWHAPRLMLTPHVGGQGGNSAAKIATLLLRNIAAYKAGRPIENRVP